VHQVQHVAKGDISLFALGAVPAVCENFGGVAEERHGHPGHNRFPLSQSLYQCVLPDGFRGAVRFINKGDLCNVGFCVDPRSTDFAGIVQDFKVEAGEAGKKVIVWLPGIRYCSSQNIRRRRIFSSHST
jgi:hypothetical protein